MTVDRPPLCDDKVAQLREVLMRIRALHRKWANEAKISQYDMRMGEHYLHRISDCLALSEEAKP